MDRWRPGGDALDRTAARRSMVERQLIARGIRDERVLDAMRAVPRERFVPAAHREAAHADRPLPIGRGQTISQPYMVAKMLEVLECEPDSVALEVGAGSGYQAALLGELCAKVWAVEVVPDLAERARRVLLDLGYDNVHIVVGDGGEGLAENAPWDRIIVAAGAPQVPDPLVEQLADGGRLVMPVGGPVSQRLTIIRRDGDRLTKTRSISCVFVPLTGRHGWRPSR